VNAANLVGWASRLLGRGGGTTLPGRVALKIMPDLPDLLVREMPRGCVLVTGTNGKTTTANLIAAILRRCGLVPVHNRHGANLIYGVTSALARSCGPLGRPRGDIALFEVDEATLPQMVRRLKPRLVVVTNLFRDQLDRYGELESLAERMNRGLRELEEGDLLLNADDPLVATLGEGTSLRVSYYGIEDREAGAEGGLMQHAADSKSCRSCGSPLDFERVYYGHMGRYRCPACGLARPPADFPALSLQPLGLDGTDMEMGGWDGGLKLRVRLPGLYNVYNALAASAASRLLGLDKGKVAEGIEEYSTVFGRAEWIEAEGRRVFLVLSKNPTGFNEVIRTVTGDGVGDKSLLLALNDLVADGRDVSWIWDVDFEELAPQAGRVTASGTRAEDMALRLKYAGVPQERLRVERDLGKALLSALGEVPPGGTLYALTTYTATLGLRKAMAGRGYVKGYWEDEA